MIAKLKEICVPIILRIFNVLSNAVCGVVLARQLSLDGRGYVAIISSIIGVAVVLLSSPRGEDILRSNSKHLPYFEVKRITLNMAQYMTVIIIALLWIYEKKTDYFQLSILILITFIIIASSINSIELAFLFRRLKPIGNQLMITSHGTLLLVFLAIFFKLFGASVQNWLIAFLLTETILLGILHMLNKNIQITIKRKNVFATEIRTREKEGIKIDTVSVYLAAFLTQTLTISASFSLPADSLAHFAVGMTLANLVSFPILPFIPKLLSGANEIMASLAKIKRRNILLNLVGWIIFTLILSQCYQLFIPFFYGEKYLSLVSPVPVIVTTGIMLGALNVISTIFRGQKYFLRSIVVNLLALLVFNLGLVFYRQNSPNINTIFNILLVALAFSFLIGVALQFSKKEFLSQV